MADAAFASLVKATENPEACGEALMLISKLFGNIIEHKDEPKFRRLNLQNAKLQSVLFRHAGASELFAAAGFVKAADGHLELPAGKNDAFISANATLANELQKNRHRAEAVFTSAGAQKMADDFQDAVHGGARGAGLAELTTLSKAEGGMEVLQLLEKILNNIRRYPTTEKYRSVNLTKGAGQKVMRALPLLEMIGFVRKQKEGEDHIELPFVELDLMERLCGMLYWATRPPMTPEMQAFLKPSSKYMSHVLGAVLGAAIGDALAAPLAGKAELAVKAKEIDKAMEMPGGGIWCVAPGQCSDSTELAMILANALGTPATGVNGRVPESFPLEAIAVGYGKWGQSRHFHTEKANGEVFRGALSAEDMKKEAGLKNERAVGAGALVRCPMLAALATNFDSEKATAEMARKDTLLSHPSLLIGEGSAAYTVLARSLIKLQGDRKAALAEFKVWVEAELAQRDSGPQAQVAKQEGGKGSKGYQDKFVPAGATIVAFKEMTSWIAAALENKELPFKEERLDSSARVAFTHAVRHVKLGSSFEQAMRFTLAGGGDSSANASVVGGLIGAAVGLEGIPPRWLAAVLSSDHGQGQNRPQEYHPYRLRELVKNIAAP